MKKYFGQYAILFIFIGVLLLPALDRKLHFLPLTASTEKRDLATRPVYGVGTPSQVIARQFEAFWNDNFGGRNFLITLRAELWIKLFYESPVPSVVIGKDSWLFYKSEAKDDGPGINDTQGLVVMEESQITRIVSNLESLNKELKEKGVTLIVTVAPNKSTIYGEELPSYIRTFNGKSRLDQLIPRLPKDLIFVDLRQALLDGKSLYPTYQKTDSHWNDYGALLATQAIVSHFPASYHPIVLTLDDYLITPTITSGDGDLASMMNARGIFQDLFLGFKLKSGQTISNRDIRYLADRYSGSLWVQDNKKLPRLMLVGDSFRTSLGSFLAPYFSETHVLSSSPKDILSNELLGAIKPNIVILELVERYIHNLE